MRILRKTMLIVLVCVLLTGSVSCKKQEKDPEAAALRFEGVDTACEAQFAVYEGPGKELFLSEGDRIAVISPSALPTREQVDATLEGLRPGAIRL